MFSYLKNRKLSRWGDKGMKLVEKGDYGLALSYFEKFLNIEPYNDQCWFWKGKILDILSNYELGVRYYDVALKLNPKNTGALMHKAIVLSMGGNAEKCIELYKKVLEIESKEDIVKFFPDIYCLIMDSYMDMKNSEKALDYLNEGLKLNPTHIRTLTYKGLILNYLGQYDDAIGFFDKAIELRSLKYKSIKDDYFENYPMAFSGKAVSLFNLEKYEDVLNLLDEALKIDELDLYALHWKVKVLKFFNKVDEYEKYCFIIKDNFGDDYMKNFEEYYWA